MSDDVDLRSLLGALNTLQEAEGLLAEDGIALEFTDGRVFMRVEAGMSMIRAEVEAGDSSGPLTEFPSPTGKYSLKNPKFLTPEEVAEIRGTD